MAVLSITEFTRSIKEVLEDRYADVSLQGEISNFKAHSSGHLYFSLKDEGAQLSAVLFRGQAAGLLRLPKDGDQVRVKGTVTVYAQRGNYQLVIQELSFLGVGELLLRFEALKQTLAARGWFDLKRKRPLPKIPKRIGVITSPSGAVIQDILHVLERRFKGFHLILNPVKVQGEGAADEIAKAIEEMNRYALCDVLIVGRGGGSIEDLWAFNEERVAEAIFSSKIPVISAVGHETDVTIADFVADLRAPTPSAAAEMASMERENLLKTLRVAYVQLKTRIREDLRSKQIQLHSFSRHPIFSQPKRLLQEPMQRLDFLKEETLQAMEKETKEKKDFLDRMRRELVLLNPSALAEKARGELKKLVLELDRAMGRALKKERETIDRLSALIGAIHPKTLLKKGYSLLFKGDELIFKSSQVKKGDPIRVLVSDGQLFGTIEEIK
jgi:exodeoxyribonuclease VII large subunit